MKRAGYHRAYKTAAFCEERKTVIEIQYGRSLGDATNEYIVNISKPMTVREFIDEWLQTRPDEWGYFGIFDGKSIFGDPKCEYRRRKVITQKLPVQFLDSKIKCVYGSGGWTRSDFQFAIED